MDELPPKKRRYLLPCACTVDHRGGCWFAWYDYLEYAKFLKIGVYKRCSECFMCGKHSQWDDIPIG